MFVDIDKIKKFEQMRQLYAVVVVVELVKTEFDFINDKKALFI